MSTPRDEKGHFLKGTSGNPKGRAKREVEQAYYDATVGSVPIKEWQAVIKAMIKQAQRGNVAAAQWLGNYLVGKPQDRLDITSGDEKLKAYIGIDPADWDSSEKPDT